MKKLSIYILLAMAIFIYQPTLTFADTVAKVDLARVFTSYKETQTAEENFKNQQEKLKEEFEKRQSRIDKAKERGDSEEELITLIKKMEEELEPKQKQLVELNNQLMSKLRNDILAATREVAKSYGVDTVLDSQVVHYGGFDLTDFVIEKLND